MWTRLKQHNKTGITNLTWISWKQHTQRKQTGVTNLMWTNWKQHEKTCITNLMWVSWNQRNKTGVTKLTRTSWNKWNKTHITNLMWTSWNQHHKTSNQTRVGVFLSFVCVCVESLNVPVHHVEFHVSAIHGKVIWLTLLHPFHVLLLSPAQHPSLPGPRCCHRCSSSCPTLWWPPNPPESWTPLSLAHGLCRIPALPTETQHNNSNWAGSHGVWLMACAESPLCQLKHNTTTQTELGPMGSGSWPVQNPRSANWNTTTQTELGPMGSGSWPVQNPRSANWNTTQQLKLSWVPWGLAHGLCRIPALPTETQQLKLSWVPWGLAHGLCRIPALPTETQHNNSNWAGSHGVWLMACAESPLCQLKHNTTTQTELGPMESGSWPVQNPRSANWNTTQQLKLSWVPWGLAHGL